MGILSSIFKSVAPLAAAAIPGIGPVASGLLSAGVGGLADTLDARSNAKATSSATRAAYNEQFQQQLALGEQTNAQRIAEAQKQMDFQREMSNTSHQREIDDLAAAGLNPILSSKYGGASTPGGAMAQIADVVSPAAATASARASQVAQRELMASQVNQQHAAEKKMRVDAENAKLNQANIKQTNELLKMQTKQKMYEAILTNSRANISGIDEQMRGTAAEYQELERFGRMNESEMERELGALRRQMAVGGEAAKAASSLYNVLSDMFRSRTRSR